MLLSPGQTLYSLLFVWCLVVNGVLQFSCSVIGRYGSVWLSCLPLIRQDKGTLRPPAGLSRVSHPQVCLCTSVQRLEKNAVLLYQAKCVLHDCQLYRTSNEARLLPGFIVLVYRDSTTVQLYKELNGPSKVCAPKISTKTP